jgi:RNA polymerase sigma-70 factor (ECF subfamily)
MFFRNAKKAYTVDIDEGKFKDLCDEANLGRYMSTEDQEQLVELLNGMEQEQLDLIELRFFQEMSFKEIADIYSITEANAKMRVYRILEKLNKKWSDNTESSEH